MTQERIRIHPGDGQAAVADGQPAPGRHAGSVVATQQVQEVHERAIPDGFDLGRDRVHWGPIVAGLLTALTSLLLLSLLGLAVGLTTVNAGTAAAQGGPPPDAGRNSAIWAAVSGVLSFLIGGYVAGRTAAIFRRNWGMLNGALVFMLAVPLILWLAGQGPGTILGSLGNLSGALASNPSVTQAAEGGRNTAWGALAGSLVALAASTLGGWLGTRHPTATQRTTRVHN